LARAFLLRVHALLCHGPPWPPARWPGGHRRQHQRSPAALVRKL